MQARRLRPPCQTHTNPGEPVAEFIATWPQLELFSCSCLAAIECEADEPARWNSLYAARVEDPPPLANQRNTLPAGHGRAGRNISLEGLQQPAATDHAVPGGVRKVDRPAALSTRTVSSASFRHLRWLPPAFVLFESWASPLPVSGDFARRQLRTLSLLHRHWPGPAHGQ